MQGRPTHRPTICVFGHQPTGSAGTLFLLGIMVGVVALLELSVPATWRSPTESGIPGSNINGEPTAQRTHR
jgi:hypothetical protein